MLRFLVVASCMASAAANAVAKPNCTDEEDYCSSEQAWSRCQSSGGGTLARISPWCYCSNDMARYCRDACETEDDYDCRSLCPEYRLCQKIRGAEQKIVGSTAAAATPASMTEGTLVHNLVAGRSARATACASATASCHLWLPEWATFMLKLGTVTAFLLLFYLVFPRLCG